MCSSDLNAAQSVVVAKTTMTIAQVFAIALGALVLGRAQTGVLVAAGIAVAALGAQVVAVRPALTRRSDAVLADPHVAQAGRSHAHVVYVAFELVKVFALVVGGILLLA